MLRWTVVLLGLVLALGARGAFAQLDDVVTGTGFVSGQVVDATGPVPGALVHLFLLKDGARVPTVVADAQGRFVFSGVPEGEFSVLAWREGWRHNSALYVKLRPGEHARVTVSLQKHALVSGRVTDEEGKPIPNVWLWPRQWVIFRGHRQFAGNAAAVRTDDLGRFTASLEPGNWIVGTYGAQVGTVTDADGSQRRVSYGETFFPQSRTADDATAVALQAGEERHGLEIRLRAESLVRVSGVLTRTTAEGTMPSTVELQSKNSATVLRTSRVNAQGRFAFEDVAFGSYVVQTQSVNPQDPSKGWILWARATVDVADRDLDLSVDLHAPLLVSGRVVFDGVSPQSLEAMGGSVGLWLYREDERPSNHDFSPYVPVGSDGRFTLMVVPGKYVIAAAFIPSGPVTTLPRRTGRWIIRSAIYQGIDVADIPLDVSRDTGDIVVTLTDQRTLVRGRVTSRQGNVEAGSLIVFPADETLWTALPTGRRFYFTSVPRGGVFDITSLPEGDYLIAAVRITGGAEPYDGTHSALLLRAISSIAKRVRVLEGQTRTVDLDLVSTRAVDPALAPVRKPPDVSERAGVRVLPVSESREVVDRQRVRAELDAKRTIVRGTVLDEYGLPLPDALVHIRAYRMGPNGRELAPPADADEFPGAVRTDPRGEYRAFGLAPGEYLIHAMPPGEANETALMTTPADLEAASRPKNPERAASRERVSAMYAPLFYPDAIDSSQAQVVQLTAGDERVADFHFRRIQVVTLSGEVRSPLGGVVGASLELFPGDVEMPQSVSTRHANTDSSGAFRFREIPPGKYRLVATGSVSTGRPLFGTTDLYVTGDQSGIAVDLQPPGTVLVRLRDSIDDAQPRVRVVLTPIGSDARRLKYSEPIPSGDSFSFRDVVPGRYRFELAAVPATPGGVRIASQRVNGAETITTGFEVRSGVDVEVVVELTR